MERVFDNLFRISAPKGKTRISHTFFIKRKKGNILIGHHTVPTPEDIAEIEDMGGIESQWVCHSHDLLPKSSHEDLYEQFGCKLHYHQVEQPPVQKKTKCPDAVFEGDRTTHGADFEALYMPTCTAGHSIYRWRNRGKYYLFTSHAIYLRDGKWNLKFSPRTAEFWLPQISAMADLQVDYIFPGYTPIKGPDFYQLDESAKVSLSEALRAKAKEAA